MDRRTLEEMYLRHRQGLYLLALSVTRCPAAAEDAVHDAFARICASGIRPSGDPLAYVFAMVRNAACDLRRARGLPNLPASLFNGHAPDPRDSALAAERDRAIRGAVDGLPDEQREAVALRVYAGLSFEQMAAVLDEPLPTVASRYRRALDHLRERLGSVR